MAAAQLYRVVTTLGSTYDVAQAEYEQLLEQDLVATLLEVFTPPDPIVISPTAPTSPAVGTVWFNITIP